MIGRYEMNVKTIRLEEVGSTNDYAKSLRGGKEDTAVLAKRQTGGRGTKGRSFSSNEGGVYLSLLRFYDGLAASDAFQIMQTAAAAVCETLVEYGVQPKIKWPNDVYVRGKKICGILIENTFSGNSVASSIVGIGVNVHNRLEEELSAIATTLASETGVRYSVDEVAERLLEKLYAPDTYLRYARYLGWLGEEVTLLSGEKRARATLLGVDERGNATVEIEGQRRTFAAAEITVRVGD